MQLHLGTSDRIRIFLRGPPDHQTSIGIIISQLRYTTLMRNQFITLVECLWTTPSSERINHNHLYWYNYGAKSCVQENEKYLPPKQNDLLQAFRENVLFLLQLLVNKNYGPTNLSAYNNNNSLCSVQNEFVGGGDCRHSPHTQTHTPSHYIIIKYPINQSFNLLESFFIEMSGCIIRRYSYICLHNCSGRTLANRMPNSSIICSAGICLFNITHRR